MRAIAQRIGGGIAGGFTGAIAYVLCRLCTTGIHFHGLTGLVFLMFPGFLGGAILGALYPKPFVWLAGFILDLFPQ